MARADQLWIMVDVETSGPVYGRHSMTELGAAVGSVSLGVVDRFEAVIRPIGDEVTVSRESFDRAKREGLAPGEALGRFAEWSRPYRDRRARFIARPAAFDWPWIVYYAWRYLGENPFGFRAMCASSWFEARGRRFAVELPHVAVADAEIQLRHFLKGLREWGIAEVARTLERDTGGVLCIGFSPDGKHLAWGGSYETVKVWEFDSDRVVFTFREHNRSVYCLAFSPDGGRIASGDGEEEEKPGRLRVWEPQTGKELVAVRAHSDAVSAVAWSPDGRRVATAGMDGWIKLFDAGSGAEQLHMAYPHGQVRAMALSPDGRRIAGGGDMWDGQRWVAGELKVWDAESGAALLSLGGHEGAITGCAFSPNGAHLASSSADGTIRLWDVGSGAGLFALVGHTGAVHGVAFGPDGRRLASSGADRTVRVWDLEERRELLSLEGHAGPVNCVAFSPDGKRLASGSDGNGEVMLWELAGLR